MTNEEMAKHIRADQKDFNQLKSKVQEMKDEDAEALQELTEKKGESRMNDQLVYDVTTRVMEKIATGNMKDHNKTGVTEAPVKGKNGLKGSIHANIAEQADWAKK